MKKKKLLDQMEDQEPDHGSHNRNQEDHREMSKRHELLRLLQLIKVKGQAC